MEFYKCIPDNLKNNRAIHVASKNKKIIVLPRVDIDRVPLLCDESVCILCNEVVADDSLLADDTLFVE